MKRFFLATALTLGGMTGAAGAATLDFMGYANAGEYGVTNGTSITSANYFGGETLTFEAFDGTAAAYAYFDAGDAGLGVCRVLTNPGLQCTPSNDDNVTSGESVTVTFAGQRDLSGLLFRAEGHVPLVDDHTLMFGTNGGSLQEYTFADLMTRSFTGVSSMTFAYGGSKQDQFYVQAATISAVPLPAAGLMLLGGLGGLAALKRKRRAA